jgi:hypothetical protein
MSGIEAGPTLYKGTTNVSPTAPPNGHRHNYVLLTGTSRCTTIICFLGFTAQRLFVSLVLLSNGSYKNWLRLLNCYMCIEKKINWLLVCRA